MDIPEEIQVIWSSSPNLIITSTSADTHTITISATSDYTTPTGWVEANLQFPHGGTLPIRYSTDVGAPPHFEIPYSLHVGEELMSSTNFQYGVFNLVHVACYEAGCGQNPSPSSLGWNITATNSYVSHVSGSNNALVKPNSSNVTVSWQSFNECGPSGETHSQEFVVDGYIPEGNPGAPSTGSGSGTDAPLLVPVGSLKKDVDPSVGDEYLDPGGNN